MLSRARKIFAAMFVTATFVGLAPASAQAPGVESRTFHFKAGTAIEKPGADCANNMDWLLVKGPGIADAKNVKVTPHTATWQQKFPSTICEAPNCFPLFIKIDKNDAVGPRTVSFNMGGGKEVTTTFEVVANAGRCDAPAAKK